MSGDAPAVPSVAFLEELERAALELAREAGEDIAAALARELSVSYKSEAREGRAPTDPVSEADHAVEALVRRRLAERLPEHGIVGEEVDLHPRPEEEFVWVVDPVDGTTNFVNGFPLFACSIGVLHRGRPVVGAIWCSTSHELRPGVYHAHEGGALCFEGAPLVFRANAGVERRLAAAPGGASARADHWDHRVTGSSAIECAFVAAGIFNSAAFAAPAVWDVAAGVVLVRAAGLDVWTRERSGRADWRPFERFEPPARVREDRVPTLRDWRRPLLMGEPDAARVRQRTIRRRPGRWRRLRRWLRGRRT